MVGLADLITLAQDYTWLMILLLWLGSGLAFRSLKNEQAEIHSDVEALDQNQDQMADQVNRVDQKQDHVVERQEMILERMGMNAQEIQELQEETARLDERHQQDDTFYRGSPSGSSGDD